jgi:hypothetical protein
MNISRKEAIHILLRIRDDLQTAGLLVGPVLQAAGQHWAPGDLFVVESDSILYGDLFMMVGRTSLHSRGVWAYGFRVKVGSIRFRTWRMSASELSGMVPKRAKRIHG